MFTMHIPAHVPAHCPYVIFVSVHAYLQIEARTLNPYPHTSHNLEFNPYNLHPPSPYKISSLSCTPYHNPPPVTRGPLWQSACSLPSYFSLWQITDLEPFLSKAKESLEVLGLAGNELGGEVQSRTLNPEPYTLHSTPYSTEPRSQTLHSESFTPHPNLKP